MQYHSVLIIHDLAALLAITFFRGVGIVGHEHSESPSPSDKMADQERTAGEAKLEA